MSSLRYVFFILKEPLIAIITKIWVIANQEPTTINSSDQSLKEKNW